MGQVKVGKKYTVHVIVEYCNRIDFAFLQAFEKSSLIRKKMALEQEGKGLTYLVNHICNLENNEEYISSRNEKFRQ